MGDVVPVRPVSERKWLKPTGPLPLASTSNYDSRGASDGGCDSPAHLDGCQAYYMKVRLAYPIYRMYGEIVYLQ